MKNKQDRFSAIRGNTKAFQTELTDITIMIPAKPEEPALMASVRVIINEALHVDGFMIARHLGQLKIIWPVTVSANNKNHRTNVVSPMKKEISEYFGEQILDAYYKTQKMVDLGKAAAVPFKNEKNEEVIVFMEPDKAKPILKQIKKIKKHQEEVGVPIQAPGQQSEESLEEQRQQLMEARAELEENPPREEDEVPF